MTDMKLHLSEKQKKYMIFLLVLAILGIVLLRGEEEQAAESLAEMPVVREKIKSEEERLSALLCKVKGAGKVEVMIRLDQSSETIYATEQNETYANTSEENHLRSEEHKEQTIAMRNLSQGEEPLVVKTLYPQIVGVMIVAEGADEASVKHALIEGATVYLDIPTYKVAVLTMEKG